MTSKDAPSHSLPAAAKTAGNPEGKGVNGLLLDWQQSAPHGVAAKPALQLLSEFFTSIVVLSAEFRYRPAVGTRNYLYWLDGKWSLSLISPVEWSEEKRAGFIGTAVLRPDMTWSLQPADSLAENSSAVDAVRALYAAFAESLDNDQPLLNALPFYNGNVAYYQRLFGSAMSRSLRSSLALGGASTSTGRDWLALLPETESRLPLLER